MPTTPDKVRCPVNYAGRMGGRSKPPWAVYGQRELLQPRDVMVPTLVRDQAEYQVTSEFKTVKSEVWEVRSRILRFVRTLREGT